MILHADATALSIQIRALVVDCFILGDSSESVPSPKGKQTDAFGESNETAQNCERNSAQRVSNEVLACSWAVTPPKTVVEDAS